MGVAGVGLVGVGTATAAPEKEPDDSEKRGTVTFAASAVTHRVDFPSEEARAHSLVAVNTLPEHAVFQDEGILSYNHLTTRETARRLEENPAVLWHDDYRALPVSDAGSTRNVWVGVDAIEHPRLTKGALLEGSYRPPGFDLTRRGETVRVTVDSEQTDVAPGERFRQELPSRELGIRVSHRSEGTTEEPGGDSNGGSSDPVRQLEVTPTVRVTNYGEVEIRAPEGWTPREREESSKEGTDQ